jgi:hypothetical protein
MAYEETLKKLQENELLLDLDNTDQLDPVIERLKLIHKMFRPIKEAFVRRSRNGKGYHVRVFFETNVQLDGRERCALHAICGSDPIREILRLRSIRNATDDQASVFLDNPSFSEELLPLPFLESK